MWPDENHVAPVLLGTCTILSHHVVPDGVQAPVLPERSLCVGLPRAACSAGRTLLLLLLEACILGAGCSESASVQCQDLALET